MQPLTFGQQLALARKQQRNTLKQNPAWQTTNDVARAELKARAEVERVAKAKAKLLADEKNLAIKRAKEKLSAKKSRSIFDIIDEMPMGHGHIKQQPGLGKLKSRPLKLEECTPVKIDDKTTIYVRPGRSIQAAIDAFKNRPEATRKDKLI